MRLVITGGRDFDNYARLSKALDKINRKYNITLIIEGEANGADTLAKVWAMKRDIEVIPCPADWSKGKVAGILRNQEMIDKHHPDIMVAFKGNDGTHDMITRCKKARLKRIIVDKKLWFKGYNK